jgi:hypothetical protein
MKHYIDALYDLARAGQTAPFRRTPKSTHDNPLRRLGRAMAALLSRQERVARIPKVEKTATGAVVLRNPERRQRKQLAASYRAVTGRPMSGRQWRRFRRAMNRGERLGVVA